MITDEFPVLKNALKFSQLMGDHNPLSMDKRNATNYSDEFVFRKAKIYDVCGPRDDRLQLQVMPELNGIDESEMEDLPKYPPFIKGEVITGRTHKDSGDSADYVWVLCTPDLQVGYVLGLANNFGKSTERWNDSYSHRDVRAFLQQRQALPEDFDYAHIKVVWWNASDKGGSIHLYNYMTGDWVLLNTSGSIITVQQKQIYMRVGTPPDPPESGPSAFSAITMTPDKITCKTTTFEIDAHTKIFGKHGAQLAAISGRAPSNDNGVPVFPIPDIAV